MICATIALQPIGSSIEAQESNIKHMSDWQTTLKLSAFDAIDPKYKEGYYVVAIVNRCAH